MSGLDRNTYYGQISKYSREINKLDENQVREAIELTQINYEKGLKTIKIIPDILLENGKLDITYVNISELEEIKRLEDILALAGANKEKGDDDDKEMVI